jgi:membrane associated rhomboid family serine protease
LLIFALPIVVLLSDLGYPAASVAADSGGHMMSSRGHHGLTGRASAPRIPATISHRVHRQDSKISWLTAATLVMGTVLSFFRRLFIEKPWAFLAWPGVAMVAGTLLHSFLGQRASRLAIVPRTLGGLLGIVTAPFVHGNASHLAANLPPFAVLGALVLRHNDRQFLATASFIALSSGGLLWVLGRSAAHVGMSGVIFGFFGYLIALAYITRGVTDVLIAGGVLVFYGSMLAGIKPARNGTSWEGHLFGLVAGIATAWLELGGFK